MELEIIFDRFLRQLEWAKLFLVRNGDRQKPGQDFLAGGMFSLGLTLVFWTTYVQYGVRGMWIHAYRRVTGSKGVIRTSKMSIVLVGHGS